MGCELRMAVNHWKLAIDTHASNFPQSEHDCNDVSAIDPRRYPSTNILIASPECTNHSLAKGAKRKNLGQGDLFNPARVDPAEERSRATMWDVPRFAEYHDYDLIIVENVVDARWWVMWDAWLQAMRLLGYSHRLVSLNSMFCHPTPQSRDRLYIVFWKSGNPAPVLALRPAAPCSRCGEVEAVQSWKVRSSNRSLNDVGRYRKQYIYTCPTCRVEVTPYYFCALNAIDWSVPATRIGDRPKALKEKTRARVQYGLEKFGRHPLLVTAGSRENAPQTLCYAVPTLTGSDRFALASPFLVETTFGARGAMAAMDGIGPWPTQTTRQSLGVVTPFLITMRGTGAGQLPSTPIGLDEVLGTVSAGGRHHALIQGAAVMTLRDHPRMQFGELTDVLDTQCGRAQAALIQRSPFLVQYYGQTQGSSADEAIPTVTSVDRHGLVEPGPELEVDDCYFRMLQPKEIQSAMAFPESYRVLGTSRDRVKQLGNAVTPPAMSWLIRQCVASLHPETAR